VAFAPDGQTLASGACVRYDEEDSWRCAQGEIILWEGESGEALRTLEGHADAVISVAFAPDGQTLASGSWDGTVKLWDAESGEALHTLEGHIDAVTSIAFAPDGQTLASGSWDGTVRLWDAASGDLLRTLEGHTDWVTSIAFAPDGQTLASASGDGTVRLWDAASGDLLRTLEGHTDWVTSIAFSPDGQTLASGSWDSTVRLWGALSEAEVAAISEVQEAILGRWAVVRGPQGAIEREPGMPDYDYGFHADGTLESMMIQTTFGDQGTTEYTIDDSGTYSFIDNQGLKLYLEDETLDVQVTINGDRMTLIMDGVEAEFERVGPAE
jgi:hypothetical protein